MLSSPMRATFWSASRRQLHSTSTARKGISVGGSSKLSASNDSEARVPFQALRRQLRDKPSNGIAGKEKKSDSRDLANDSGSSAKPLDSSLSSAVQQILNRPKANPGVGGVASSGQHRTNQSAQGNSDPQWNALKTRISEGQKVEEAQRRAQKQALSSFQEPIRWKWVTSIFTDGEFLAQRFPFDSSAGARNFLDRVIALLSPTEEWSGSVTLQKAKQRVQFVHVHLSDVHGTKNQDVHSLASKVNQIYKECSSTAPIESFMQMPTRSHAFTRAQQDSASITADVLGAQTSGTNESQVEEHVPVTIHKRPGQKASEVFVADGPSPTGEALGVDHLPTPSPIEESVPVPSLKNE